MPAETNIVPVRGAQIDTSMVDTAIAAIAEAQHRGGGTRPADRGAHHRPSNEPARQM